MAGASRVLFRSTPVRQGKSGTALDISRRRAGWRWVSFAVRTFVPGSPWADTTRADECCLVLLSGRCTVEYDGARVELGPRRDVFAGYPHALYLPPRTSFRVLADELTELADGRAPVRRSPGPGVRLEPVVIRPEDCGFE